ncbi:DUF4114 domain-containing protein [uncultured Kordia sp.]|uniref:DUF4114 domain-containing protein n=1 Tax=uncultured Kordia sp. TaxID=507699 RepID=UPI002608F26C|nr:DUF4114 domain-containing protein [uncultured Kordia sp.]
MKKLLLLLSIFATATISAQTYQYLGDYTANGTPLYLESPSDDVSIETLEMISNSIPESYPVPDYNPHYISSGYDTNLELNQTADVWVTFISEGAGYRNVLGFYTYDVDNPSPTPPNNEDITIIFPNASALGSGGGLQVGDKVKIGTFEAGTGIGWVLLANAWSSSASTVGNGLWKLYSNPDYNPEAQEELRYHNVLLNDPENERIILGFEDIRRDYGSCDNDFNDAVFYVTANPYTALKTTNYPDVESASNVTSAYDGGLESNGNLAGLIAKRNLRRTQSGNVLNKKQFQTFFSRQTYVTNNPEDGTSLDSYLPETGMFGTETAYLSSPTDLLDITNASEVFALDMYQNNTRVSAVLATATEGAIYDHSKVICDRLNNSSLEDVRTVTVRGHQLISAKIKRPTGETEYTLSFSVKLGDTANNLYSFWNIEQYPEGDYYNFQIWGSSLSQVFTIGNHIIDTLTLEKPLNSQTLDDVIPPVFVRSGYYANGNIHLNIVNKVGITSMTFDASIAATEVASDRTNMTQEISLTGYWTDYIEIPTGQLFDVGLSLSTTASTQQDALYLADGPWGIDYQEENVIVNNFFVGNTVVNDLEDAHEIERQPTVSGQVQGTINLFRHVLPGDQTLDVSDYDAFQFRITNSQPVEVILLQEGLGDWNNRFRVTIPENNTETVYHILFNEFEDGNGNSATISDVKTIIFSLQGDYHSYTPFDIQIHSAHFGMESTLSVAQFEVQNETDKLLAIPNPMTTRTEIQFTAKQSEDALLAVYDQVGKVVYTMKVRTENGQNKIPLNRNNLRSGLYFCSIKGKSQTYKTLKIIVK